MRVGGSLVLLRALAFALIRPQLTTTVSFSTQAGHGVRVNLSWNRISGPGVVVEGQFGARGNIAVGEKGEVVEVAIILVLGRYRHNLAIWITRMIHEPGSRAKFAAIDNIFVFHIVPGFPIVPIQRKEVGLGMSSLR